MDFQLFSRIVLFCGAWIKGTACLRVVLSKHPCSYSLTGYCARSRSRQRLYINRVEQPRAAYVGVGTIKSLVDETGREREILFSDCRKGAKQEYTGGERGWRNDGIGGRQSRINQSSGRWAVQNRMATRIVEDSKLDKPPIHHTCNCAFALASLPEGYMDTMDPPNQRCHNPPVGMTV